MYNIGFAGLEQDGTTKFRGLGSAGSKAPAITSSTRLVIHPTYATALDLQNVVIDSLTDDWELRQTGILVDVPEAISLDEYYQKLVQMKESLETLPVGPAHAPAFEGSVPLVVET